MNKETNKVLELASADKENGTLIKAGVYKSEPSQFWRLEPLSDGYIKVINVFSGKCLDVSEVSQENGKDIHQWEFVNGDNQKWKLEK